MITLSMYRQLDEATPERFEPVGRVRDAKSIPKNAKEGLLQLIGHDTKTGAPVRYNAQPPDWSPREGPSEFTHWLLHTEEAIPDEYTVVTAPDGRGVVWTMRSWLHANCPGPCGCG
jgi:hypothetical protein